MPVHMLSILSDEEATDLRGLDVDALLMRFHNLKPHEFKPASLSVYKSRLTNSLQDLERYRRDPTGFRPQVSMKDRAGRDDKDGEPTQRDKSARAPEDQQGKSGQEGRVWQQPPVESVETIVFPIPLRPGVIVRVSGIPGDLTPDEAAKIGNVILALSGSQE